MTSILSLLFGITLTSVALTSTAASAQNRLDFTGSFSEVVASGEACSDIFSVTDYHARHIISGPTGRTSLLHWTSDTDGGFFADLNFVGLLGGNDDLYYEKSVTKDGRVYSILSEGFVSWDAIYLETKVTVTDEAGAPVCDASAVYGGFPY